MRENNVQSDKMRMAKAMKALHDKGWTMQKISLLFDYKDKKSTRVHDLLYWIKNLK